MTAEIKIFEVWDGGDPITFNIEHIMFFEKADVGETFIKLKDGSFKWVDVSYETFKELYENARHS